MSSLGTFLPQNTNIQDFKKIINQFKMQNLINYTVFNDNEKYLNMQIQLLNKIIECTIKCTYFKINNEEYTQYLITLSSSDNNINEVLWNDIYMNLSRLREIKNLLGE